MKILIFALIFYASQVSSQSISCAFGLGPTNGYRCNLTIDNPTGFDGFTNIPGEHLEGRSNNDVREIEFITTTTTIFPQIICQQFPRLFNIRPSKQLEIQTLSYNSFRACRELANLRLNSPITSIHPEAFYSNSDLFSISLNGALFLTVPSDLFKFNLRLSTFRFDDSRIVEIPPNLFISQITLSDFTLSSTELQPLSAGFLQNNRIMRHFRINNSRALNQLPRNFLNSSNLSTFQLSNTGVRQLDFFSVNNDQTLSSIIVDNTQIEAIDFNILDIATNLRTFQGTSMSCALLGTTNFQTNRAGNLAILEPCFVAFDERILAFSTTSTNQIFNSIRRERVRVRIQTFSDAILIFSNSPDGSGSNFEIHLGADGNRNSFLYENGVLRSSRATPGLLNIGQFVDFEISWQNGLILVSDQSPLLVHIRTDLFPVRFVGVRTRGANAFWRIQQLL